MLLLKDGILAVLAALGMGTVLWLVVRTIFLPRRELYGPIYLLLPVSGRTFALERTVGEMQQLRQQHGELRILLVDCGMTDEQRKMVRILQREDPLLGICKKEDLTEEFSV